MKLTLEMKFTPSASTREVIKTQKRDEKQLVEKLEVENKDLGW